MITQENIPYTADEIRAMVKTCERYNKALERARNYHDNFGVSLILEDIFPELRENEEDEKIRKVLIGFFDRLGRYKEQAPHGSKTFHGIPTDDIIAWLEKQKSFDEEELKQGALKYVARQFMNWLEEKILEDEMYLSNVERKAIEDAFLKRDWTSISRYMLERIEREGKALPTPTWFVN